MPPVAGLDEIASRMAALTPSLAEPGTYEEEAAVAACLRVGVRGPEALFIRRAEHPEDPWSGHAAFPGGRRETSDATLLETAVRETLEETGLDVSASGKILGRLDDVHPRVRRLPSIVISPFVFGVGPEASAEPRSEVVETLWIPLVDLADPGRTGSVGGYPSIVYEGFEIWGLTHRIVRQLLELARPT